MEIRVMEKKLADLRVLLVEDQAESRALLKGMLGELGITQIYEAGDGKKGLQFVDSAFDFIDIILCDWNMPSMTGIEFLRQVRSTGADIPFMMITGRSDHNSVIEAKNFGVSGFIRKPYSPTQIEAKLRVIVSRMKAA
jgi:two-component system chemotaxis response regulator CheY